jgi:hypothetical protein
MVTVQPENILVHQQLRKKIYENEKHAWIVKRPDLEAEMKKWPAGHRNSEFCASTGTAISEVRGLVGAHSITDCYNNFLVPQAYE